jgi:rubrerythrin
MCAMYSPGTHPGVSHTRIGFKNYAKFIADLQKAINDQASAVAFYGDLEAMAKTDRQQRCIDHARRDEMVHLRLFKAMYRTLTGRHPHVQPTKMSVSDFKAGILQAFDAELEAAEMYRDMYLSTQIPKVRDVLFRTMTDEMEHAQRFSFIYHE